MSETYYTPSELAKLLKLDAATVRARFVSLPGVLVFSALRPGRRPYRTIRIPASAIKHYEAIKCTSC